MNEIPVRYPPSLVASSDSMEPPVVECGMVTRLGGELVQCIRRAGHPVRLDFAHTNGYKKWAFDEPSLHRQPDGSWA